MIGRVVVTVQTSEHTGTRQTKAICTENFLSKRRRTDKLRMQAGKQYGNLCTRIRGQCICLQFYLQVRFVLVWSVFVCMHAFAGVSKSTLTTTARVSYRP